jgi:hypothetical protein
MINGIENNSNLHHGFISPLPQHFIALSSRIPSYKKLGDIIDLKAKHKKKLHLLEL